MDSEKKIRLIVGVLIIISSVFVVYYDIKWLWLGVFVSIMLIQSSFTGVCPMECFLDKVCKNKTSKVEETKKETTVTDDAIKTTPVIVDEPAQINEAAKPKKKGKSKK